MSDYVYETSRYGVKLLDEQVIANPEDTMSVQQPFNYAIVNKDTGAEETYVTFQHVAINLAEQLTNELDLIENPPEETTEDSEESNVTPIH